MYKDNDLLYFLKLKGEDIIFNYLKDNPFTVYYDGKNKKYTLYEKNGIYYDITEEEIEKMINDEISC